MRSDSDGLVVEREAKRFFACTGVDAEMLAAGYLESMKENLGRGVRKKKERGSRATMICI